MPGGSEPHGAGACHLCPTRCTSWHGRSMPIATLVRFIDEHRHDPVPGVGGREFGVESICRVLTEHGCQIAPSTYYAAGSDRLCPVGSRRRG